MLFSFNFILMNREAFPHTIYGNSRDGKADTLLVRIACRYPDRDCYPSAGNTAIPDLN
jgi:hypothetical protein